MNSASFVSNVGNIELDNDCQYSLERRSTRNREDVVPKEDLAFYFQQYIQPKYGLGNINVNNVASFMKDLEMNWSKLTPDLKDKVMNILVDSILTNNYDFKSVLMKKLNIPEQPATATSTSTSAPSVNKSSFGSGSDNTNNTFVVVFAIFAFVVLIVLLNKTIKPKPAAFSKMF